MSTGPEHEIVIPQNRAPGFFALVIAAAIGIVPALVLADVPHPNVPWFVRLALYALPTMAIVLFVFGLRRLLRRAGARIAGGAITLTRGGLLGSRTWTVPAGAYLGIAHVTRRTGQGKRRKTTHVIVLIPREDGGDTPALDLATSRSAANIRGGIESWARRLNLPAVSHDDIDGPSLRDPGELDSSLADRLARGTLKPDAAAIAVAPPASLLDWQVSGKTLTITRRAGQYTAPYILGTAAVLAAIAAVGIVAGSAVAVAVVLVGAGLAGWVFRRDRHSRQRLVVTGTEIRVEKTDLAGNVLEGDNLAIPRIEELLVQGGELVFIADGASLGFGALLPRPVLSWARHRVLAAIAGQA